MLVKRAVVSVVVVTAVLSAGTPSLANLEKAGAPASEASVSASSDVPSTAPVNFTESEMALARTMDLKKGMSGPPLLPEAQNEKIAHAEKCGAALDRARYACLENFSPHIQNAVAIMSALGTVIGSVKDQCSQSAKNLDMAQKAMTLYNGACAAMKAICETSCHTAEKRMTSRVTKECKAFALKSFPVIVPLDTNLTLRNSAEAECVGDSKYAGSVFTEAHKVCTDYRMNLAAGVAALAKIVMDKGKAEQCKEESGTVDCTKDPTNASCNQKLDCSLAANNANPICICEKSPRSPGCGGSTNVSSTNDYMKNTGGPAPSNALGGAPSSLGSGLNDSPYYSGGGSNGSGGGLAGGGGGAGGGGSGAAKGTDGSNKGEKAALNANVLEGGGGGGGFRGGSGGGYNANDPYGKYKAYIPKDGNGRGLAGTAAADQVTGSNGLSNWQKVKTTLTNNRPTLLDR